ncbi:hypothetical protein EG68_05765 [Paragonimus skrjabini miyazakii]|uniref:Uncharacterized protein n=1 Tax=Paragonimus skrjabini miyazakii TaxID=59628 RepID=A0A8S9YR02_9TREM|nr:hypothetical protein EG68_05765 [Paragonimus skrjabini miyazakii]
MFGIEQALLSRSHAPSLLKPLWDTLTLIMYSPLPKFPVPGDLNEAPRHPTDGGATDHYCAHQACTEVVCLAAG